MVPEDPVAISFNDGQEEAEREIKFLCTRLLAGWQDLNVADMKVSRISGGISNLLVKVEPPPPLNPVAVKVFGDKTELLIDREAEKRILLRLNEEGFGAPVIGVFSNGRIERFLEARTLTPEDVCDAALIPHIARRLRAFHDLQLQLSSAAGAAAGSAAEGLQSSQWDVVFGWLKMAEALFFPHDPAKQAAYDKVDFGAMRLELEDLRRVCGRVASPRVLCHNDLLSANILLVVQEQPAPLSPPPPPLLQQQQQTEGAEGLQGPGDAVLGNGTLQFIDFEYSCYGPRGFDFGNHFNEYAGFDCDYGRFPSAEKQKEFFRHYLKPGELRSLAEEHLRPGHQHRHQQPDREPPAQQAAGSRQGQHNPAAAQEQGFAEAAAPESEAMVLEAAEEVVLERMVAEACVYALASHAFWGVWSFIQARYSPIDFDYLSYSKMRWDEYNRRKAEYFTLVDRLFPL